MINDDLRRQNRPEMSRTALTEKQIAGALKSAIDAHGPITVELIPSVVKRIMGLMEPEEGKYVTVTKDGRTELNVVEWLKDPGTQERLRQFYETMGPFIKP